MIQLERPKTNLTVDTLRQIAIENSNKNEVSVSYWATFVENGRKLTIVPKGFTTKFGSLVDSEINLHLVEFDTEVPFELEEGEGPVMLINFHNHPTNIGKDNMGYVLPSAQYVQSKVLFGDASVLIQSFDKMNSPFPVSALNIIHEFGMTLHVDSKISKHTRDMGQTKGSVEYFVSPDNDNCISFDKNNDQDLLLKTSLNDTGFSLVKMSVTDPDGTTTEHTLLILSWEKINEIIETYYKDKDFLKILTFGQGIKKIAGHLGISENLELKSLLNTLMSLSDQLEELNNPIE